MKRIKQLKGKIRFCKDDRDKMGKKRKRRPPGPKGNRLTVGGEDECKLGRGGIKIGGGPQSLGERRKLVKKVTPQLGAVWP